MNCRRGVEHKMALSIFQIPMGSPALVHVTVASALILHIGAGSIAVLSSATDTLAVATIRPGFRQWCGEFRFSRTALSFDSNEPMLSF